MLRHHARPKSQPPIKLSEVAFIKQQQQEELAQDREPMSNNSPPKSEEEQHWSKMIEKYEKSRMTRFAAARNGSKNLETLNEHYVTTTNSANTTLKMTTAAAGQQLSLQTKNEHEDDDDEDDDDDDDDEYEPDIDISPLTTSSSGSSSSGGSSLASSTLSLSSVSSASTVMAVGTNNMVANVGAVSLNQQQKHQLTRSSAKPIKSAGTVVATTKDSPLGSDEESSSNSSSCSSSSGISSIGKTTEPVTDSSTTKANVSSSCKLQSATGLGQLEQEVGESLEALVSSVVAGANKITNTTTTLAISFDVLMVKEMPLSVPYEFDFNNNNNLVSSSPQRDIINMSRRHIFNALTHAQRVGRRESSWRIELHLGASGNRIDDLSDLHIRWFKQKQAPRAYKDKNDYENDDDDDDDDDDDEEMIVLAHDIIDCLVEHEIVIWLIKGHDDDQSPMGRVNGSEKDNSQSWVAEAAAQATACRGSSGSIIRRTGCNGNGSVGDGYGPIKRANSVSNSGETGQFACEPNKSASSQVCGNLIGITADCDTDHNHNQEQQQQEQTRQLESVIWLCSNELEAEQARMAWVEFSRLRHHHHLERLVDEDETRLAAIKSAGNSQAKGSSSAFGGGDSSAIVAADDAICDRFAVVDNLASSVQVASALFEQVDDQDDDEEVDNDEQEEETEVDEDEQTAGLGDRRQQFQNIVLAGHEPETVTSSSARLERSVSSTGRVSLTDPNSGRRRVGELEKSTNAATATTTTGKKTVAKAAKDASVLRILAPYTTEAKHDNNNETDDKRKVNKLVNEFRDDDVVDVDQIATTSGALPPRRTASVFSLNEKRTVSSNDDDESLSHNEHNHKLSSSDSASNSPSSGQVAAGAGNGVGTGSGGGSGGGLTGYYKSVAARFSSSKIISRSSSRDDHQAGGSNRHRVVSVAILGDQRQQQQQRTLLKIGSSCDLSSSGHPSKSKQATTTAALRAASPVIKLPAAKQTAVGHPQPQQHQQTTTAASASSSTVTPAAAPIVKPRMSILKRQVTTAPTTIPPASGGGPLTERKQSRDKLGSKARPPSTQTTMINKQQQAAAATTASRDRASDSGKHDQQQQRTANIDRNRMDSSGQGQARSSHAHEPPPTRTKYQQQPQAENFSNSGRPSKRSLSEQNLDGANTNTNGSEPTTTTTRRTAKAGTMAPAASIDQLNDSSAKCISSSSRLASSSGSSTSNRRHTHTTTSSSSSGTLNNCAQVVVVSTSSSSKMMMMRDTRSAAGAADEYPSALNEITLTARSGGSKLATQSSSEDTNENGIRQRLDSSSGRKLLDDDPSRQQQFKQPSSEVCKELQLDSRQSNAMAHQQQHNQKLAKVAPTTRSNGANGEQQQAKQMIVTNQLKATTTTRRKAVHSLANCELLARHHNQQLLLSTSSRGNGANGNSNSNSNVSVRATVEAPRRGLNDCESRQHKPNANDNGDGAGKKCGDNGEENDDNDDDENGFVSSGSLAREQAFERLRQRASCYDITRLMSKNSIIQNQLARLRATGPLGRGDPLSASSNDLRQRKPAELHLVEAVTVSSSSSAHSGNRKATGSGVNQRNQHAQLNSKKQDNESAKQEQESSLLPPTKKQANKRMSMIATGTTNTTARPGSEKRDGDRLIMGDGTVRAQVSVAQLRRSVSTQLAAEIEQKSVSKSKTGEPVGVGDDGGLQSTGSRRAKVPGGVAVMHHQHQHKEELEKKAGQTGKTRRMTTTDSRDRDELSDEADSEDPSEEEEEELEVEEEIEEVKVAERDDEKDAAERDDKKASAKPAGTTTGLSKFNLLRQSFNQKTISSMLKFSSRASLRIRASKSVDKAGDEVDNTIANHQECSAKKTMSGNELVVAKQAASKTNVKLDQQQQQQIAALDSATLMLYNRHMQQRQQQQQQLLQQQHQYAIQWQQHQMYIQQQQHHHHQQQRQQLAFMANHYVTHQQHQLLTPPGVHQLGPSGSVAFGGYTSAASSMYALGGPPAQLHNAAAAAAAHQQLMMVQQQTVSPPSSSKMSSSTSAVGGILRKSILKSSSNKLGSKQDVARVVYAAPQQQQQQQPPPMVPLDHKHHYAHTPASQLPPPGQHHHQHMVPLAVNHHSSVNIVYGSTESTTASYKQQRNSYGYNEVNLEQAPLKQQSKQQQQQPTNNSRASSLGASMRKTVKSILINRGGTSEELTKKKESKLEDNLRQQKQEQQLRLAQKPLKSALKSPKSRNELILNLNSDGSDGDQSNSSTLESSLSSSGRFDDEIITHERPAAGPSVQLKSALKKSSPVNSASNKGNNPDENSTTDDSSTASSTSSDTNFKRAISARCSRRLTKSPPRQPETAARVAPVKAIRKNVTFSTKLTSIQ